jgi:sterol desaturase/sphingolipid hydroxylase (fatty acid hydroxylase superfamily)
MDHGSSADLRASLTTTPRTRRRVALPTIAIAAAAITLVIRGLGAFGAHSSFASAVSAERWTLVGPLMLGVVAVAIVVEQIRPAVRRPLWARGHVHDGLYLILYAVAVVPLVVLIGTGSSAIVHQVAPWLAISRPSFVPAWLEAVTVLIAIDWLNWLAHLANHRIPSLWRLHAVHHSQEELSVLTAFRAHPLVHVSFLLAVIPTLVLVGAGPIPPVVFAIYAGYGAMTHANVRWGFGPLGRVLVSPAFHRVHHAADGPIDVNLGTVLTVWDRLSGRAVMPVPFAPSDAAIRTGLSGRPMRTEQAGIRPHHLATLAANLLGEPFLGPYEFGTEPGVTRRDFNHGVLDDGQEGGGGHGTSG